MATGAKITKRSVTLQYMAAGTTYTTQLEFFPILDAKGEGTGSRTNRIFNLNRIGQQMLTTEVASAALVNSNGKYHVDYSTGILTCRPALGGYPVIWYQTKETTQP